MISADDATRDGWVASLKEPPVLCHLAESRLRQLLDDGELRQYEDGAELIHADTRTFAVFLLVDGACDVQRVDARVRLHAPALIGEIAALTGTSRTATVCAVGCASAVVIERESFLDAIRSSAAAGQELTELVADRICAPDSIQEVGRFKVEGIIGRGGSGRVFRARHPLLDIPIALKMLSHALALLPDGPSTFIREASLLVHLDHPGIVRVLDAFEAHGTFFIVMPWIEGGTLRDNIDGKSKFSREQILRVADEALDALVALHAAGMVHRDIKPSNLLLTSSGKLVLIDFGIACECNASSEHRLIGSPSYSSPEQILGRPVDGRSDVYSLACTLYELVFAEPPFGGDEIDSAIDGHLHGTVTFDRPALVDMGAPFLHWLKRCLSRTRINRPSAAAARAALRDVSPLVIPHERWSLPVIPHER